MKASMKALALLAGCALAGSAFAQCTNDSTVSAIGTFSGNTCGKNAQLGSICTNGDVTNGFGTSVVQINFGSPAGGPNITLQVVSSTANFNPELAFTTGACNSNSGCTVDDTNNTQTVGPDSPSPQPASGATGFVFITDLNTESPGCGDYNLTVAGTIPVQLQDFSVQ